MTGCEIIHCPDFINGKCTNESDCVDFEDGTDICPKHDNAMLRKEYENQNKRENFMHNLMVFGNSD
jgi:hypothetical protein